MHNKTYDVLIVGAGPAGAACAIRLGKSGLKVAVLDKAGFPRDKTCGDAVSVDVINQLSLLSDTLLTEFNGLYNKLPSYGVKIFSPNHDHIDIPFFYQNKKTCGYVCPRKDFDNVLFQHMKQYESIHVYENCTVDKVIQQPDKIVLKTTAGDFEGQVVVGADGAHSVVSKQLSDIEVEKEHYSAGLRIYYEGVTSFHKENFVELHFFKDILPGYLWIFPLKDNKANVGIGMLSSMVSKKRINLKETLQELLKTHPNLRERFKDAKPLETVKGYGLPLGSKRRNLSGERFLLAGDAASLIDPFSGEGIANAIRSGRVAGEHLMKSFEQKNYSALFNKAYDIEIYRRMWKELKVSRGLQRLVRYPLLFNFLVKKANNNQILQHFFIEALADVEQKKMLTNPRFYYHMLFHKNKAFAKGNGSTKVF